MTRYLRIKLLAALHWIGIASQKQRRSLGQLRRKKKSVLVGALTSNDMPASLSVAAEVQK